MPLLSYCHITVSVSPYIAHLPSIMCSRQLLDVLSTIPNNLLKKRTKKTKKSKKNPKKQKTKERRMCKVVLTFLVMEFSLGLMKDQAEIISESKGIFRNCEIKAPDFFWRDAHTTEYSRGKNTHSTACHIEAAIMTYRDTLFYLSRDYGFHCKNCLRSRPIILDHVHCPWMYTLGMTWADPRLLHCCS